MALGARTMVRINSGLYYFCLNGSTAFAQPLVSRLDPYTFLNPRLEEELRVTLLCTVWHARTFKKIGFLEVKEMQGCGVATDRTEPCHHTPDNSLFQ